MKRKIKVINKGKVIKHIERVVMFLVRSGVAKNIAFCMYLGKRYYVVDADTYSPLDSLSDRKAFDNACIVIPTCEVKPWKKTLMKI